MSYGLNVLAQNRNALLLAEITGLLHNVGKLDPNFLAATARDPGAAMKKVNERLFAILQYDFDRFAAPDPTLLRTEVAQIMLGQKWQSRADFMPALKTLLTLDADKTAMEEMIRDESQGQRDHPFFASTIEAAWQFCALADRNGPLYECLSSQREALQLLGGELESIQTELSSLHTQIRVASPVDKAALGARISGCQRERDRITNSIATQEVSLRDQERLRQVSLETGFRNIKLMVGAEIWSLADLLTLFSDTFFFKPNGDDYKRQSVLSPWLRTSQGTGLPVLLILSHGEVSSAEKGVEKSGRVSPAWGCLRFATAFGYDNTAVDPWQMPQGRHQLLKMALTASSAPEQNRSALLRTARQVLEQGLGDTQWPINEITLWDYAATITTLFKAAVAKTVLEGKLPTLGQMRWRLVAVRYDGLGYLNQVLTISDLLARREILRQALDAVQVVVEVEYPLGNEVYRDENGSVLLVPHVGSDHEEIDLLQLPSEEEDHSVTLDRLLIRRFATAGENALNGELAPIIALSAPVRGKDIRLTQIRAWKELPLEADKEAVASHWQRENAAAAEVCTVCGLRPQGPDPKARERRVCNVCERRRSDRSEAWTRDLTTTIWTDEVADSHGRLALIVGQFDLDFWLDGRMVQTLLATDPLMGTARPKNPSFARIRRVWETTRTFWLQVQSDLPQSVGVVSPRLIIEGTLQPRSPEDTLGRYHVYELVMPHHIRLSTVWDVAGQRFITCDNLDYLAGGDQLGQSVQEVLKIGSTLPIEEPAGYGSANKVWGTITLTRDASVAPDSIFIPAIPILAEPRTFMALVPADKPLAVVQAIKTKYEREMGKVRNRLPLHLGIVYAGRRTPLRAVLDAGRRMLAQKALGPVDEWKVSRDVVKQTSPLPKEARHLADGTQQFDAWYAVQLENQVLNRTLIWHVPAVMGDGATEDNWYPYVCLKTDTEPTDRNRRFQVPNAWDIDPQGSPKLDWLVHAGELKQGDLVYFISATFDFEFLDTAARRFEIVYDEQGRRRGRHTRPYLLEELTILDAAWDAIAGPNGLTNSQIHALRDLIESKREEWRPTTADCTSGAGMFWRFCRDVILTAQWPEGRRLAGDALDHLTDWAARGLLADVIELRMGIMKESARRSTSQKESTHE